MAIRYLRTAPVIALQTPLLLASPHENWPLYVSIAGLAIWNFLPLSYACVVDRIGAPNVNAMIPPCSAAFFLGHSE